MIGHRQLTVVRHIHLPVRKTAGDEPLAADTQHLGGGIKSAYRFRPRHKQESQPPGPGAEVKDIQPIYPDDFVDRARDVSQIIFPRDQGFVPMPFRLIDLSLLFAHVHLFEKYTAKRAWTER